MAFTDWVLNTDITHTHSLRHTYTLLTPKHADEWQDMEAMFWVLLQTVWRLLTRRANKLAKANGTLCQTAESYQQCSPGICLSARRAPTCYHPLLVFFHYHLFIYLSSLFHNLVFLLEKKLVSNYLRAIHYKWHPLHCTDTDTRVLKQMRFAFTLCSSVLMNSEIEGRKAFIFWQKCYAGAWISAFIVRLSSVWRIF